MEMIEVLLLMAVAAALFWWCCYRLWTAEDED